ncbi:MAG: glycosyltransferase [Chloroflexota bacterium]|nr:glycosyltransferase [Chloroflexota bacterium]
MPEDRPYLTVAIAAFNEEHRLPQALDRALAMLTTWPQTFETVICDDGSTDHTVEVVQDYAHRGVRLVRLRRNRGKGAAVRAAVLAARGEYVLFSDADFSTPITELPRVLHPLEAGEAEITIGSRRQADGSDMRASQPRYRRAFGKLFHALAALVAVRGIGDTQAGFKALRGDVARELFARMRLDSIVFDVELLYLAQRSGYRVCEVPVRWTNAGGSRMRVTVSHAARVLWDLLRIRWLHRGTRRNPS